MADGHLSGVNEAADYLESHRIRPLLQYLLASLTVNKPEDPQNFLISEINKIKEQQGKIRSVLSDTDYDTLFKMIDLTNMGYISRDQCQNAFLNLGLKNVDGIMKTVDSDRINSDKFTQLLKDNLNDLEH